MTLAREEVEMSEDIAYETCHIWAFKVIENGQTRIVVRHSSVLTADDPLFQPVDVELSKQCATVSEPRTEYDDTMMFAEAVVVEFWLLETCPGSEVAHRCAELEGSLVG